VYRSCDLELVIADVVEPDPGSQLLGTLTLSVLESIEK